MCDQCIKNTSHAFFDCNTPKSVWSFWSGKLAILANRQMDIVDVALQVISRSTSKDLEIFIITAWYIWFNRNQVVFESTSLLPSQIWDYAVWLAKDFKGALAPTVQQQGGQASHRSLPPLGFPKVNVDEATTPDGTTSSNGVIIWDSFGHVTTTLSKTLPAYYLHDGVEAISLENDITLAYKMNIPHVVIESDSLSIV